MKIHETEMFNGAAIAQIIKHRGRKLSITAYGNGAFDIDDTIGLLCKYATKPGNGAYNFSFDAKVLKLLSQIERGVNTLYVALICPEIREVCALSYELLRELIGDSSSKQHTIRVETDRKSFVVSIRTRNDPKYVLKQIPRNLFPRCLFDSK